MPNREAAFVEEKKLGYLFRGKNKGGYFVGLGFSQDSPDVLRGALLWHAQEHGVEKVVVTEYGTKYDLAGVEQPGRTKSQHEDHLADRPGELAVEVGNHLS